MSEQQTNLSSVLHWGKTETRNKTRMLTNKPPANVQRTCYLLKWWREKTKKVYIFHLHCGLWDTLNVQSLWTRESRELWWDFEVLKKSFLKLLCNLQCKWGDEAWWNDEKEYRWRKDVVKVEQGETGKRERQENKNERKGKMKFKLTFHWPFVRAAYG